MFDDVNVAGEAADGTAALAACTERSLDAVFLGGGAA